MSMVIAGLLCASRSLTTLTGIPRPGPEDLTRNQIAAIAFDVLERQPRIIHVPPWILGTALAVIRQLSPSAYGVLSFIRHVQATSTTAPNVGSRYLREFSAEHLCT